MKCSGERHFRFTRVLLMILGLWPYQKATWRRHIQRFLISMILINAPITQLNTCFTRQCDMDYLLKIFPFVMMGFVFILKYVTFYINFDEVKELTDFVCEDWNSADEGTYKILDHYATVATHFNLVFACKMKLPGRRKLTVSIVFCSVFSAAIYPAILISVVNQALPFVMDVIKPLNVSRPYRMSLEIEIFIDQDTYFYFIMIIVDVFIAVGTTAILATETMSILFVYHSVGLFKTVRFTERVVATFGPTYFILVILGVLIFTLSIFRLHQAILNTSDTEELASALVLFCAILSYSFGANYNGQQLVNHSTSVFHDIYDTSWYLAPLPVQKLLLIVMRRSMEKTAFLLGGVYPASFEGFSMITRMSVSYFMFISSTR